MHASQHASCRTVNGNSLPLYTLGIFLTLILCSLFSIPVAKGQYLLRNFRPKVKSSPHTAVHIVQDDGKIVMLGDYAFAGDTPVPNLVRLEADGSLDKGFSLSNELRNQFTTDFGQCCLRANVVQGPDNDLVLIQATGRRRVTLIDGNGKFKSDIQTPSGYFGFERLIRHKAGYVAVVHKSGGSESIFRLDKNGHVDPGFVRIDYDGYTEDLVVDANNNIFLVGSFTIAGITRSVLKINEVGALDNTFANVSIASNFSEIHLFPDGRIVVSSGDKIVLLGANGSNTASFVPATDSKQIYSSAIDAMNNRIIILLEQYPQPAALLALNLDGSISDQFTPISIGSANAVSRILPKGDRFVLTTGDEMKQGSSFLSFLEFGSTGTVDISVSSKEKLFNVGYVNDAVELADGSFIVGGSFTHIGSIPANNLAKLDASGNADVVFADNNPLSRLDIVEKIAITSDEKLYVGGFFNDILGNKNSLIRIRTNGQLDASFVTHATSTSSVSFLEDFIVMSDRVIACGNYVGNVVAFDFNGNIVPGFRTNIFGAQSVSVNSLCKIDNDNFAMGGYVLNNKGFLWIMDPNGNIDNAFVQQNDIPISADHLVLAGNELYWAGYILGGQSSADGNFIYKYSLLSGGIEPTKLATYTFSKNNHVLPLNDSMMIVSGKFDRFNTANASNFVVSNFNGSPYPRLAFHVSPGVADHQLSKTVLLPRERILLLGHFDSINDEPFYGIAMAAYTNFKPVVNINDAYSVPEDTSFYLSDLIEITDMDDALRYSAETNDKFDLGENGWVTLKQNFAGTIEVAFNVQDPMSTSGPFTTTFDVKAVNDAPVIKGQLEVRSIVAGQNYEIGLGDLDVVDVDSDDLTLYVLGGDHYTLSGGTSILGEAGFNGDLKVGVSVSDGMLSSDVFEMIIQSGHPTGIEEISEMAFYPNPFTDYLRISAWDNIENLSIHSTTSQNLATYDQRDLSQTSGVIYAGTLPKGMLLVSIQLKTKELLHIKLVRK